MHEQPARTFPPPHISLMASGDLRDALEAIEEGRGPAAVASLMAIDAVSWQALEERLVALIGTDLRALLLAAASGSGAAEQQLV
ncbi:hypothetical protein AB0910_24465 [Streptomyces sp. NPDC047002]|uniref:hypothetical protein n=1 Tax=Streptomyces sp. NPDC047002 TaxID=3155475 RepID=UPI00345431BC